MDCGYCNGKKDKFFSSVSYEKDYDKPKFWEALKQYWLLSLLCEKHLNDLIKTLKRIIERGGNRANIYDDYKHVLPNEYNDIMESFKNRLDEITPINDSYRNTKSLRIYDFLDEQNLNDLLHGYWRGEILVG